jgi:[ribosomal protein S5]-alanine N-acetyltransferase
MVEMSENWPVFIKTNDLIIRPLRLRDHKQWVKVRSKNVDWLGEWEATIPKVPGENSSQPLPTFYETVFLHRREGRQGRAFSLAIWHESGSEKTLIGQITLGGVMYGAMRGGHIGYWIDKDFANRGLTTQVVAAVTEFAFNTLSLHRIEINIRPENSPSIRVAEKAGYLFEGLRPRYLHIDGQWRDHSCYVKENIQVN